MKLCFLALLITSHVSSTPIFELAQKHAQANEYALALDGFQKRVALGNEESPEFSFSLYNIGLMQEALHADPTVFIESYNRAFLSKQKAEPLFRIANYHLKNGNAALAYVLSQYALSLPEPPPQQWKDAAIHDYALLNTFAFAAFSMGKTAEAKDAFLKVFLKPNIPPQVRKEASLNLELIDKQLRK
jgi:hypothetical protein